MILIYFNFLQTNWTREKKIGFLFLLSRTVSPNVRVNYPLARKEFSKDLHFFHLSRKHFHNLSDHNKAFDNKNNNFNLTFCTHLCESKYFRPEKDGIFLTCKVRESDSPNFEEDNRNFFREGKITQTN